MGEIELLRDQSAYNGWANARVFGAVRGMDAASLDAEAPGTHGSLADTLTHMIGVEDVYLMMLRDVSAGEGGASETYFAQGLDWFTTRAGQLDGEYQRLLAGADDAFLAAALHVPWFDFALTKRDGLLQVLAHSAQHRAQVLSVLGARGLDVPGLDFVGYVQERRP